MAIETFDEYLARQVCDECGEHADHSQAGRTLCRACLDPNERARALND